MTATSRKAAPVGPGVGAPGGSRLQPNHPQTERSRKMLQPLSDAIERIEEARIIVERHLRSAADDRRLGLIHISEHLTSALTRLRLDARTAAEEVER